MPVSVVIARVTVIVVSIIAAVITAPLITLVVVVAVWLVGMISSPNILLDLLVSLVSIYPFFATMSRSWTNSSLLWSSLVLRAS
jgi:hypothetical protein